MKKSDPWLLGLSLLGFGLVWLQKRDFGHSLAALDAQKIRLQPGKEWMVNLKDGKRVMMNSTQLANALESRAVKTYQQMK